MMKRLAGRCLSFSTAVIFASGCFDYGAGPAGVQTPVTKADAGAAADAGAGAVIEVSRKRSPGSGDPQYVIKAPAGAIEVFLKSPGLHDHLTFRPANGSVITTWFQTAASSTGEVGSPTLIHDETTGNVVRIATVSPTRVEFHHFNRMGNWLTGFAVFQETSKFKMGRITGAPAFSGQILGQLTAQANGGTGSFAVVGQAGANLADVVDVTTDLDAWTAALSSLARVQQPLTGTSNRQPVLSLPKVLKAAGLYLIGGAVVAGLATTVIPMAVLAYGAAGVCMVAAGYFSNDVANFVEKNFQSTDPFAQSMVDIVVGNLRNPDDGRSLGGALTSIVNVVKSVANTGKAVLTGAASLVDAVKSVDSWPQSPWQSSPQNPLPTSYEAPTPTSTPVTGQAVWQDNTTWQVSGSVDSAGQVSLMGTSTTSGSLTVTGTSTSTTSMGTFTSPGKSGTFTGTVAAVGACMTSQGSGGQGTFTKAHNVGPGTGVASFSYDAFSVPDAFTVTAGGRTLFSTGGLVSGAGSPMLQMMGEGFVFVSVSAPQSGTQWTYQVGCVQ
ncbi:MAG: hypothetical protein IAE78_13395 [Myxococcus sp.]|nr:hypothetical protein [Myxococcus sp.]